MKILKMSGVEFLMSSYKVENRNILSHFITIGAGTIINMFLSLLTTPIITRLVDPSEYGQLSIFTMYTGIALMVLCIGLDQALVRYYYDREDLDYKKGLLKLCFVLPLIVSCFCAVVVLILVYGKIVSFEFKPFVMVLLCVNVVANLWSRIAVLLLRITYQSKKYALSNIIHKIVYIVVAIPLVLLIKGKDLEVLALATIISFLIQALYATVATREMWKFKGVAWIDNSREIIRYGIPYILSMGLTTLFQAVDKISLNYYCSYTEVGIYSSAMTLVNIFAVIQTTFNALWGPMQVEHYVKNPEDTSFIKKGNRYITIVMFFIGLSLILTKDIFSLLLGEKYHLASYILPFLIFNPIMYTISETTCSGIGISKKSYLNIYISIGACAVNIVGNGILVPILGCQGAAISTGISYIVFWALRTYFSNKYYYIDYDIKHFSVITIITLLYAWYNTFYDNIIVSFVGYLFCVCILFCLYKNYCVEGFEKARNQLLQLIKKER